MASTPYCLDADLDARYGKKNVDFWADADADANSTKMTARRLAARTYAASLFDDYMRKSKYSSILPITGIDGAVPNTVIDINVKLAGYWLSTLRGCKAYDKDGNPVTKYYVDYLDARKMIKDIQDNALILDVNA